MRSESPLGRVVDAVWRPTPASIRRLALFAVIANAGIIVSGGAVRLTKSGLGCPTWPKCTGDSLVPTSTPQHSSVNMAIEFGNRTLTFLVLAVGIAVFVAALRFAPRRRDILRLGTVQPLGVVAQAVMGGITVLTGLHPATVAIHYLLSATLLLAAVTLHVRAGEGDRTPAPLVGPWTRRLVFALTVAVALLLAAGTVVTGTGPHAGDDTAPRFGFQIEQVARVHSELAWLTVLLTIAVMIVLRRTEAPRMLQRRAAVLLAIELAQGVIGYVQYFTGVPAPLVALHMLGSALLWIAALRVLFGLRDRGPLAAVQSAAVQEDAAQDDEAAARTAGTPAGGPDGPPAVPAGHTAAS